MEKEMKRARENWGRKEVTSARRSIAAYWFSEQRQSGWAQQRQRSDREEQKEKLPNRHRERSRDLHNFIQSRSMTRSLDCSPVLPVWFQFMSSSLSFAIARVVLFFRWLEFVGRSIEWNVSSVPLRVSSPLAHPRAQNRPEDFFR